MLLCRCLGIPQGHPSPGMATYRCITSDSFDYGKLATFKPVLAVFATRIDSFVE